MSIEQRSYLFASVDAPPRVGGVANLATNIANTFTDAYASKAVFVGPSGTYFNQQIYFDLIEDFNSDIRLRDGTRSAAEEARIEDFFSRIIDGYTVNEVMLFHPFYYAIGAIRAARKRNIRSSLYLHGTEVTSQVPAVFTKKELDSSDTDFAPNSLASKLLSATRSADILFTNSHFSKSLVNRLAPSKPIYVSGCGIEETVLKKETEQNPNYAPIRKTFFRERTGLAERLTFVSVGRHVPHKRTEAGIHLMSEIPDAQLVVIGDGPKTNELKQLAAELAVADRIIFVGAISEEEKWNYLRAADVGILSSTFDQTTGGYEGFGIVMLEYAAAGCVVLTPGTEGMHDFAIRYKGALIGLSSLENDALKQDASMLSDFFSDLDRVNYQVNHAREVIAQRYTWKKVTEVMHEIMTTK
ncbi:glycosyltransferase family 4 protein [Ponticaulis profundi]|uniref:Glycosyltransferase family 4 protein n=1 Tax=Ponticaulis profundi TaxID=2665222 RepID=A0ABW1SDM6_9PROT